MHVYIYIFISNFKKYFSFFFPKKPTILAIIHNVCNMQNTCNKLNCAV